MPVRQMPGLVAQPEPAAQATQVPEPLHTRFEPQLVPAERLVAELTHT